MIKVHYVEEHSDISKYGHMSKDQDSLKACTGLVSNPDNQQEEQEAFVCPCKVNGQNKDEDICSQKKYP